MAENSSSGGIGGGGVTIIDEANSTEPSISPSSSPAPAPQVVPTADSCENTASVALSPAVSDSSESPDRQETLGLGSLNSLSPSRREFEALPLLGLWRDFLFLHIGFNEKSIPYVIRQESWKISIMSFLLSRNEEYRQLFHLPQEEVLVQDFNCALQENILLQGHMYLFLNHICFYSNIFGFETKKIIFFPEVTCVRKAKTAGLFPNAIEIVASGKKYFFGSFISRDEAYRLIVDGWAQYNTNARDSIDSQESKSDLSNSVRKLEIVDAQLPTENNFERSIKEGSMSEEPCTVSNDSKHLNGSGERKLPEAPENVKDDDGSLVDSAEQISSGGLLIWNPEDADAPKVPGYYKMVAEAKFPISPERCFMLFFSDSSIDFGEEFHKKCGDKNFHCTQWYKHDSVGFAREVQFEHPIKLYFGAKFAQCKEVQKLCVYRDSHFIVQTSQEMNDVPFSDHFRVEGFWDVERGDQAGESCVMRTYINVAFSKKTIFKGKIEQSTAEECREAYTIWISNAHDQLQRHKDDIVVEGVPSSPPRDIQPESAAMDVPASLPRTPSEKFIQGVIPESTGNKTTDEMISRAPSLRKYIRSIYVYLKGQSHFTLGLMIFLVSILVIMQLSIIFLLVRTPTRVQVVHQPSSIFPSDMSSNRAESIAWLEKHMYYLKEEMGLLEIRMDKMRREYSFLKAYLHDLEQSRTNS